jgi:hypothetical protein
MYGFECPSASSSAHRLPRVTGRRPVSRRERKSRKRSRDGVGWHLESSDTQRRGERPGGRRLQEIGSHFSFSSCTQSCTQEVFVSRKRRELVPRTPFLNASRRRSLAGLGEKNLRCSCCRIPTLVMRRFKKCRVHIKIQASRRDLLRNIVPRNQPRSFISSNNEGVDL